MSDRDILSVLPEMEFDTADPDHPFNPETQVQPCSIDIRLDGTFWRQKPRKSLDLRRAKLLELSPRRYWSKVVVDPGGTIVLKPGEMLLGRTYEEFTIPESCAGKIEGRSSFARMGLSVHCSADFINPGWRGRMPLELVNLGKHTLRLFPRIPISQVILVRLTKTPNRTYGVESLNSKYMNDDGGPSYWWRDKRIRALHKELAERDASERVQAEILEFMGPREPELVERFERQVGKAGHDQLGNAADLLDAFATREDRSRILVKVIRSVLVGLAPALAAGALASLFSQPYGWLHYALWLLTVVSIPASVYALRLDPGEYLGSRELEALRREKDGSLGKSRDG